MEERNYTVTAINDYRRGSLTRESAVSMAARMNVDNREAQVWYRDGTELKPSAVHGNTAFYPLPPSEWRPFSDAGPETGLGPCCCRYCSPEARSSRPVAAWDALACDLATGNTWTVHYPELHGKQRLR